MNTNKPKKPNTSDTNWITDPVFDFQLKEELHKRRKVGPIAIADIDVEKSLTNNARCGLSIIQAHVEACIMAMERYQPIYYVKVRHIPGEKYMMIGGNHRVQSCQLRDCTHVMAYIISCDDQEYDLLTRKDNRGATGQTQAEALHHILYQHETYGRPFTELSVEFDVKVDVIRAAYRNGLLIKEYEKKNFPHENVTASMWAKLNTIRKQPVVLDKMVYLCHRYVPILDEVTRILEGLQACKTEQQKLNYLASEEGNLKASKRPGSPRRRITPHTKMFQLLGEKSGLSRLLDRGDDGNAITHIDQLVFEPKHSAQFIALWEKVRGPMAVLYKQCKDHCNQVDADRLRKAKKEAAAAAAKKTPTKKATPKKAVPRKRRRRKR